jgi:hypothetical protein
MSRRTPALAGSWNWPSRVASSRWASRIVVTDQGQGLVVARDRPTAPWRMRQHRCANETLPNHGQQHEKRPHAFGPTGGPRPSRQCAGSSKARSRALGGRLVNLGPHGPRPRTRGCVGAATPIVNGCLCCHAVATIGVRSRPCRPDRSGSGSWFWQPGGNVPTHGQLCGPLAASAASQAADDAERHTNAAATGITRS